MKTKPALVTLGAILLGVAAASLHIRTSRDKRAARTEALQVNYDKFSDSTDVIVNAGPAASADIDGQSVALEVTGAYSCNGQSPHCRKPEFFLLNLAVKDRTIPMATDGVLLFDGTRFPLIPAGGINQAAVNWSPHAIRLVLEPGELVFLTGVYFPAGTAKDGTRVPEKWVGGVRDAEGRVGSLTFTLSDANLRALRLLNQSMASRDQ